MAACRTVFFLCAALTEGVRISVYCGAADTVTCLGQGHISELVAFARERDAPGARRPPRSQVRTSVGASLVGSGL